MRRAAAILLSLLIVVACPSAAFSWITTPEGYSAVATAELYHGVEYVKLAKPNRPVVAHVAHVLPGAPVDLRVVNANDRISTSGRELEPTSSMCRRVHCIVGVNGDFHKLGVPAGAVIIDGRMLHSPDPSRPQLTVTGDGRLVAGTFPWSGTLSASGGSPVPVVTVNAAPPAGGLAVFTPEYGPDTDASTRTELVVRASGVGALNQATELQLVSVRIGAGPIPADGAVLSGDGVAGLQLQDLFARRQGTSVRLQISSPIDANMSIGAEPVVLRDGKRALPWRDPNVINPHQPHTLVGWNKQGHVYLVTVDGRQVDSDGMTMGEAADFLVNLGATDAVNLDGGGGTTFVAGGSVWNRPSDNDPTRPGAYDERSATNAFFVMARPGAPLPAEKPPVPAPLPTPVTGIVKPLDVEPEPPQGGGTGGGTNGAGPSRNSTPRSGGPTVADISGRLGPVAGVGGQLAAGELPVGPSLAASGHSRPLTLSTVPGATETPEPDGSLVAEAAAEPRPKGNTRSTHFGYLEATLALAAALTSQAPVVRMSNSGGPNPIYVLLAGLAALVAGLALAALGKRHRNRRTAAGA